MLKYLKIHADKGNVKSCIDAIDNFCAHHWMMNLGPEKTLILKDLFQNTNLNKYWSLEDIVDTPH